MNKNEFTVKFWGVRGSHPVPGENTTRYGGNTPCIEVRAGGHHIILDAGTLAAQESRRFSIKLRATKTGVYVNKATASSASGLQAESEATLTNVRQPILALTKVGPQRQYLGLDVD